MRCSTQRGASLLAAAVVVCWVRPAAATETSSDGSDSLLMEPDSAAEEPGCDSSELSCDRWLELELELGPPPDFLRMVPPPPVPEFMEDYVQRLHQASGECLLCNWAHNNDSMLLVGAEVTSSSWIPILVVVALLSALLGAIGMVAVIRCRRLRVLPSKGLCPLVSLDRPKEDAPPLPSSKPPAGRGDAGDAGRQRAWAGRLWARPPSGTGSAASYADQPYTFPDQESAVYAELNSVAGSQGVPAYRAYVMNTYSEIRDPRRLLPDGTYENAGYVLEPALHGVGGGGGGGGESGGSGSNHSSAYYSDISAGEPAGGSQRRRRRELASVSARVVYPRRLPVPINLLPDAADLPDNLENPPPESTMIAATRRGSQYRLLDSRTLAAAGRLTAPPGVPVAGASATDPLRQPHNMSFRSDPDSGQRSGDSGNRSGSEQGSLERRPLPLLPSRRVQGPQKRGVYTLTQQCEEPPPPPHASEYV
ncbi:uncharacterized protein LOC122386217 [Amphibalanus amphitrite]|uniref:uncharacterized protein LOC122386217 n=1 Tax=Amphibalanus amphitrite TaxID=1232801 RepID=UPI001C90F05B|nr:uncharacterized protein LOC122386217 [Amphibalanus amphitrite]